MGISNSPRNYLWRWIGWGWTGCVRPRAHGKVHDGRWWRDRVSGAGKVVAVKEGYAWDGGLQGEARGATNWAREDQTGSVDGNGV